MHGDKLGDSLVTLAPTQSLFVSDFLAGASKINGSLLTGFLWRAGEGSLDGAAVRVVSATDAALVLHLVGADLPVAANFLIRATRHRKMFVFVKFLLL